MPHNRTQMRNASRGSHGVTRNPQEAFRVNTRKAASFGDVFASIVYARREDPR